MRALEQLYSTLYYLQVLKVYGGQCLAIYTNIHHVEKFARGCIVRPPAMIVAGSWPSFASVLVCREF